MKTKSIPRRTAPGANPDTPDARAEPNAPAGARISRRAADRLRSGHLWVYASDIEAIQADEQNPPALLAVADNRGLLLGTALYSPSSQIALRMVSREAIDERSRAANLCLPPIPTPAAWFSARPTNCPGWWPINTPNW